MPEVVLREWESLGPEQAPALRGLWPEDPGVAADLARLPGDALSVTGTRTGLLVRARQHVGVVRLGPVQVRIRPALAPDALWTAVAWVFGADEIARLPPAEPLLDGAFLDLLASLLLAEADRLHAGGVQRGYVPEEAWLASPRGRPDLAVLARHLPLTRAELPCRTHSLSGDIPANQLVRAALDAARDRVQGARLRSDLHRAGQRWRAVCRAVPLGPALVTAAVRGRNRLTARYALAHALATAIAAGLGLGDLEGGPRETVPGFLWNMARLWEGFVTRFLVEHLRGSRVQAQAALPHLYSLVAGPAEWSAPRPRPDLVVREGRRPQLVVDAKYRDILAEGASRDIVYQLSVYALAWSKDGAPVPALALFPSATPGSAELAVALPEGGTRRILFRGVDWSRAIRALADPAAAAALAAEWTAVG